MSLLPGVAAAIDDLVKACRAEGGRIAQWLDEPVDLFDSEATRVLDLAKSVGARHAVPPADLLYVAFKIDLEEDGLDYLEQ